MADNLDVNPREVESRDLPTVARSYVQVFAQNNLEKTDPHVEFNTYVVWFAFVLGGWKALVSTTLPDGRYYEVTYDKHKNAVYIDTYVKINNIEINTDGTSVTTDA